VVNLAKKVLFLGAHPDDVEFGAGGALARLRRTGHEVKVIVFSKCAKSLPDGHPGDQLVKEMEQSMNVLDVRRYLVLDYAVRDFPSSRQAILEKLISLDRSEQYDLVIAPSAIDLHQDHSTLGVETTRAFQTRSVLHYEITKNRPNFFPTFYLPITERDLATKIKAVQCYRSQIELRPRFSDPRNIEAIARVRGMQVRVEFAEAFETSRFIVDEGEWDI
jgi:LmbE family N-acetylglucosaminyl deacetylase